MVGGDAGLAGVEGLAPGDPLGGAVQGHLVVHDGGALATELQGHRGQVRRGHGHDLPAHAGTAGEEDVIETEGLDQRRPHLTALTLHHEHLVGQGLVQQAFQHGGRSRRLFAGLHHGAVPGGDRPDQGVQHQLCGIIPRCDDQHHTQGVRPHLAVGYLQGQRGAGPLGTHPFLQVRQRMVQLTVYQAHVRQVALEARLAQVLVERFQQGLLVVQ